jgi:hypothetical protein
MSDGRSTRRSNAYVCDLIISSHLFLIEIALDHIRSHVAEGVILFVGDRAELFNFLNRDSD